MAEFTAKYAGYTCQEVAHDYELAFAAARKCAADFDWDAVVANMVYVWTGLTQAIGLKYYGIPGIDIPADTGFQYREPPQDEAFMRPDEYDALIEDPTGFLLNVWLPRVAAAVCAPGEPTTTANHLSFLKGGMAMMKYFTAFGTQNALLRSECGTVSAIAGIFKAPMDIIADKLRGYLGLVDDLFERRDKVRGRLRGPDAAPLPRRPHHGRSPAAGAHRLLDAPRRRALRLARDLQERLLGDRQADHRGACGPTATRRSSTRKASGTITWSRSPSCPSGASSITSIRATWKRPIACWASKFCLSGGIPNWLLTRGKPEEVRQQVRKVLEIAARDGGYILDAGAIVQNDATIENIRAMTDAGREFGVYSSGCLDAVAPAARGFSSGWDGRCSPVGRGRGCVSLGKTSWPSYRRSRAMPPCAAAFGKTSTPWRTCMSGRCCCRSDYQSTTPA